jgi:hypothetical protein
MMIVLVVVLAVLAVVAFVLVLVTRSRLTDQRTAAAAATATAEQTAAERDAEQARALAAELARDEAASRATDAEAQAAEAEVRAGEAASQAADAATRAAEAEARAAEAAARNGLDPDVLWTLERARSERTWRQSVALGAGEPSVFDGSDHPLREALQVELDAAREDVGAVVELDADLPDRLTVSASVLALRATQELVADIVRRSEESTVRIGVDGTDLVVDIDAVDEDGGPVLPDPLPLPPSAAVEVTATGVRIHGAVPPSDA